MWNILHSKKQANTTALLGSNRPKWVFFQVKLYPQKELRPHGPENCCVTFSHFSAGLWFNSTYWMLHWVNCLLVTLMPSLSSNISKLKLWQWLSVLLVILRNKLSQNASFGHIYLCSFSVCIYCSSERWQPFPDQTNSIKDTNFNILFLLDALFWGIKVQKI